MVRKDISDEMHGENLDISSVPRGSRAGEYESI